MILRRAKSTIGMLVLGLALAATPVAIGPASATTHHTTGIAAGGCTAVSKEQTKASGLAGTLEKAFASGNFSAIKAAILGEFSTLGVDVSKAEAYLHAAPANVKAAFSTIAKAYSGLKSQIQATTSLAQLETVFVSLGKNTKLVAAGKVLDNYFGARCGIHTT